MLLNSMMWLFDLHLKSFHYAGGAMVIEIRNTCLLHAVQLFQKVLAQIQHVEHLTSYENVLCRVDLESA